MQKTKKGNERDETSHNRTHLKRDAKPADPQAPFPRIITEDFPREKYRRRRGEEKTALHWGQRKLLMSEIEFLTPYCDMGGVMIYAGAAPGTHCYKLAEMFPSFEFYLVDPSPFDRRDHPRITYDQNFFTDELAYKLKEKYKDKNRFFVSDIRTANWRSMEEDEHEQCVIRDNQEQMRWHDILEPVATMLKFRLPYRPGKTCYLKGDVYLPVWGPQTTTETRLVVRWPDNSSNCVEYDHTAHEERLFYFNTRMREMTKYHHNVRGLCPCYDCTAEVHILRDWLIKCKGWKNKSESEINEEISRLSEEISKSLSPTRTLWTRPPPKDPLKVDEKGELVKVAKTTRDILLSEINPNRKKGSLDEITAGKEEPLGQSMEENVYRIVYRNLIKLVGYRGARLVGEPLSDDALITRLNNYEFVEIRAKRDPPPGDPRPKATILIILLSKDSKYANKVNEIRRILNQIPAGEDELEVMFVSEAGLSSHIKNEISSKRDHENLYIEEHPYYVFMIEAPKHTAVPKHSLATDEEVSELTQWFYTSKDKFPQICYDDTQCVWLGARPGMVIKIERESETAGTSIAYRLCVNRTCRSVQPRKKEKEDTD